MGTMICGNISGAILAGGENKRFGGKIKANALIGGEKIIDRMVNIIRGIFDEIIIVTNTPHEFSAIPGCKIAGDHFKGIGPLGGIHSAMLSSSKEAVFVFAGDMPFLSRKLILRQCGFYYNNPADAVIPETDNGIEPLHGIYLCSLASMLEEHIKKTEDYNIRRFLNKIDVSLYRPRNTSEVVRAFTNINTQLEAELENGKKRNTK